MRSRSIRALAAIAQAAVFAVALVMAPDPEPQPLKVNGPWVLVFEDEFSGDALDASRWNDHEPWESAGYGRDSAWFAVPHMPEQLEVNDGHLTLKARRSDGLPDGKSFTAAHINTRDKFSISEGVTSFTEARLDAPSGNGLWPAFWLLGNGSNATGEGWPINGEVDVLEFANNNNGEANRPYFSVWFPRDVYARPPGTFLDATHVTQPDSFVARPGLRSEWHTWGLLRSPERMDVFIDGVLSFTFVPGATHPDNPIPLPPMLFSKAMHLRLGLGVGGPWAGVGWTEAEYQEGDFQVDYVRVWRR
jgi:hypothetical protein